jgi:undecaprenyl-diphosphatase
MDMMSGFIKRLDSTVDRAIMAWPKWLHPLMFGLSFIGHPIFTIATIGVMSAFALAYHNTLLLIAIVVAAATFTLNTVLKMVFHRERPKTYKKEELVLVTYSFPSGHASSAVVIYGLLAYIAWHLLAWPWNGIVTWALAAIIIGIGISRVYLGAHYTTDVLVGWAVGLAGLFAIIWIVAPL